MSSTGLSDIKVNNSQENFNKNLFDVVKGKKLTQQMLLEIQDEAKIIQEVKKFDLQIAKAKQEYE